MTVLIGGPHLYEDQVPAEPRQLGYEDGLIGVEQLHPLWDRTERAAYFQGFTRGVLERLRLARTTPPVQPVTVEPWAMTG